MPLYVLGLMGVTRRLNHFDDPSLQIWFIIAAFGAFLIALGIASFLIQLVVSFMKREQLRDLTGDPWNGRTLEWSTSSPPPAYNFAFTPVIHDQDAWWDMKRRGYAAPAAGLHADPHAEEHRRGRHPRRFQHGARLRPDLVHLVARRPLFIGLIAAAIGHTFNYQRDFYIPAEEVAQVESTRTAMLAGRLKTMATHAGTAVSETEVPRTYSGGERAHGEGRCRILTSCIRAQTSKCRQSEA